MTITITGAPKLNPAQVASMRRAERAVDQAYPGQYVAYTETWSGDDVEWKVHVTAHTAAEFQQRLAVLEADIRRRVQMTRIPPADVIEVTSATLA